MSFANTMGLIEGVRLVLLLSCRCWMEKLPGRHDQFQLSAMLRIADEMTETELLVSGSGIELLNGLQKKVQSFHQWKNIDNH